MEEAPRNLDLLERRGFGRRRTQSWLTKATTGGRCGARGGQRGLEVPLCAAYLLQDFQGKLGRGGLGGTFRLPPFDAERWGISILLRFSTWLQKLSSIPSLVSSPLLAAHAACRDSNTPTLTRLLTSATVVLICSQHLSGCCSWHRAGATHPTPRRVVGNQTSASFQRPLARRGSRFHDQQKTVPSV